MIGPMPGPPPKQHKNERQYTPSTCPFIPTRRIWDDDYGGQIIIGDLVGLKFPDICLTGEEKPRKTLTQKTCPDRDRTQARCVDKRACYHLLHSGGHKLYKNIKFKNQTKQRYLLKVRYKEQRSKYMTPFTSYSVLRTLEINRILYHTPVLLCYETLSERSMKPSLQMVM